ncbi:glycosyl hydrolase [Enterococcus termitis]|uniref:Glycosyl hydrolase n=1 Tax=Enterococcus termitis TaxID=332950 RepID=A0A1E5GHP4_9ENTE|nr:glycosyl hydrolase [Enterococcus termitis]OEG12253.1 glycosyl hydrolase [Enterococcus termitis]OJG98935.1 glycosyl hydrolase [Enterococcus termitis]
MTNVHIVNHTHWDREWYFTSMDALVLSDQLFTDVITELQKNPEASFVLDGQLSILDDYLELYPEKLTEIQALIAAKQLFIGPWFTQTDAFFTSGESVLRNAMIGMYESKKYGEIMPIGYLPDTFGFNAQIPVILNEAGLENIILWRGVHLGEHVQSPYFKWESLGGSQSLYALNFPQGYGTGMLLEPTVDYVEGRLDKAVDFIKQYTDSSEIMIPSGNDQLGIIGDFSEKVAQINTLGKYNYQVSSYQEFLELMKEMDLETYRGEFRSPVLARVHKTIGSVRMDLKQGIFHLEHKLLRETEPLMVIAHQLGIDLSNRLLLKAWKKLLECQAHDSLAGCVSDAVAEDIAHRLKEADEICDSIENIVLKRIAEALDLTEQEFIVVNPSPMTFHGQKIVKLLSPVKEINVAGCSAVVLEAEYIDSRENVLEETPAGNRFITEQGYYILTVAITCELPGLGYKVFSFEEGINDSGLIQTKKQQIVMGEYQLSFVDGQVHYQDRKQQLNNFISLVDDGNAGDTYDFSPLLNDREIDFSFTECFCEQGPLLSRMHLTGSIKLPYDLQKRSEHIADTDFNYRLTLTLNLEGEVTGKLSFKNTVLNHRLRLKINLTNEIKHALSAIPYGFIQKENQDLSDWETVYSEMPVNIEPFEKMVTAFTKQAACTLFTHDSKEYEYRRSELLITLLATTDSLGKPDLLYRPGRASGDTTKKGHIMMATPLAQLKDQQMNVTFVIKMNHTDVSEQELAQWRGEKEQPTISYQRQNLNFFVYRIDNKIQKRVRPLALNQRVFSILSFDKQPDAMVSSIHRSYYQNGFIVRFENPTAAAIELDLSVLFPGMTPIRVNAVEEVQPFSGLIPAYGVASYFVSEQ